MRYHAESGKKLFLSIFDAVLQESAIDPLTSFLVAGTLVDLLPSRDEIREWIRTGSAK